MRRILFLGAPGSGKGTQAKLLEKYGLKQISTGDLYRKSWKRKDPLIMPYKEMVESGSLLPDEIAMKLVSRALRNFKGSSGYILDGAIRTVNEAKQGLREKMFDTVIFFELSEEEAIKRIKHRLKTSKEKRNDDSEEAVRTRFKFYKRDTLPVIKFLKEQVKDFYNVDASHSIKEINADVTKILGLK